MIFCPLDPSAEKQFLYCTFMTGFGIFIPPYTLIAKRIPYQNVLWNSLGTCFLVGPQWKQFCRFFCSDSLMNATQYTDKSSRELPSYNGKKGTVTSTAVAAKCFLVSAVFSDSVVDACASSVWATARSVFVDCTDTVRMVLYAIRQVDL